jgi:hypothetical protein
MQTRKCKHCKTKKPIEEMMFKSIYSFCDNLCLSNYQKDNKTSIKTYKAPNKISLKKKQRIKE